MQLRADLTFGHGWGDFLENNDQSGDVEDDTTGLQQTSLTMTTTATSLLRFRRLDGTLLDRSGPSMVAQWDQLQPPFDLIIR